MLKILPFHQGKILHPKIAKEVYEVLENSRSENRQGHKER
jgi:hypothetical protein